MSPDDNPAQNERQMTYGEMAVGIKFNPSSNTQVGAIKADFAKIIDDLHLLRTGAEDPEVKRMFSVAITELQTAQMWAVKAATWGL